MARSKKSAKTAPAVIHSDDIFVYCAENCNAGYELAIKEHFPNVPFEYEDAHCYFFGGDDLRAYTESDKFEADAERWEYCYSVIREELELDPCFDKCRNRSQQHTLSIEEREPHVTRRRKEWIERQGLKGSSPEEICALFLSTFGKVLSLHAALILTNDFRLYPGSYETARQELLAREPIEAWVVAQSKTGRSNKAIEKLMVESFPGHRMSSDEIAKIIRYSKHAA